MFFLGVTPQPLGDAYSRRFPVGVLISFQRVPHFVGCLNIRRVVYRSGIVITKNRNIPSISVVTDGSRKPSKLIIVERPPTQSFINLPTVSKFPPSACGMPEMLARPLGISQQGMLRSTSQIKGHLGHKCPQFAPPVSLSLGCVRVDLPSLFGKKTSKNLPCFVPLPAHSSLDRVLQVLAGEHAMQ
jgi:hypothetical protein